MTEPIACTLNPAQLGDRIAELAALSRHALRSRSPISGGERLVFVPDAVTQERLRAAVAAEATCCSFLDMDLRAEPDALVLDVTGPAEAVPIIAELFA